MKKEYIVFFILVCSICMACRHHGNTSITVRDSRNHYSMNAWFNENRMRDVEEYLDDKIGRRNDISFVRTRMDTRLILDDHTTFFIKKSSGYVEIKLDQDENSFNSYKRIKSMCDGITEVVK
jgi:hypothetical protein